MVDTTLQKTTRKQEDGTEQTQYRSTVPKALAEAMGWEGGDTLQWDVESGRKLSVEVKND